jgi:thiol-activated cytolysin
VARAGILAFALSGGLCACSGATAGSSAASDDVTARLRQLKTPAGLSSAAAAALTEAPDPSVAATVQAPTVTTQDGRPLKTTVTLTRYTASARYDTQVLLNPSTDVIYPGSILAGGSIEDGSYREVISGEKNDIVVSYGGLNGVQSKTGGPGVVSGTIRPTLAAFRTFHNQVMSQKLNGASSIYTLQATDASTSDSFDAHFSAGVSYASPVVSASVKGNFDYSKERSSNKYMIRFAQTFYTVDVEPIGHLLRSAEFEDFVGYRPVYVASVAYGRLAFITLESTASKESISAGISAILQTPALAVDASAGIDVKAVQDASNLNITVIGSDQVVTSLGGFRDFLENGGFSATNTGQIVSYKLRFLDDNAVASTVYNGEYTLRSVTATTGAWDVTAQADGVLFADTDGDRNKDMVDLMGELVLERGATPYTLWQRPRSDLGFYPDDATSFTDLTGETAPVRFSASTLGDVLRFRTVELYDFNPNDKSVLYGPTDQSFTLERALADGHVVVQADRADGQVNRYVKFRVKVQATATFENVSPSR